MIVAKVKPSGNLKLTLDPGGAEWIQEMQDAGKSSDAILWDGTEHYWTNGRYEPFDAGQGNPFVGLTSATCIAQYMAYADNGDKSIEGEFWYFDAYAIEDPMQLLKTRGWVYFHLAR